jgi:hypothetical protein
MNQELIKFIELCLADGVISDKEREVILRKSRELGVPEDECEIIIEGLSTQKTYNPPKDNDNLKTENNTTSVLSNDKIEEISNLDSDLLIQIINYIKGVEIELGRVMNPEFVNDKFQRWYSDLPNNLVRQVSKYTSKNEVHFKKEKTQWINFYLIDRSVKEEINDQLHTGIASIIGLVEHGSNTYTLFLRDGFVDISYSLKSNFFGREKRIWNKLESLKLKHLDILNFNNTYLSNHLHTLLIVFDRCVDYNEGLVKKVNALDITYDQSNCLQYFPVKNSFGDDVVIKLSNHIRTIVNEVNSFASNLDYDDLIPFGNHFKTRSFNKQCFQNIDYILLMLKNISSLIQVRNELLIAVLKEDRGRILLITEQLDSLGIMMNYYQKNQLDKMDQMLEVLSNGFQQLCGFISELNNSVDNMNRSLSNGLNNINQTLEFNSLLSVIQTYQVYKINKNTKGLIK